MKYLKDILSGERLYFTQKEVKHCNVPRYYQLTLKKLTLYALKHPVMKDYIPFQHDPSDPMLDRKFIITIINTIDPDFFPTRVALIMKERSDRYLRQEEDKIEVRNDLLDMLKTYGSAMGRSRFANS